MYRTLDPTKIIETVERLGRRVGERFPESGLGRVCAELLAVSRDAHRRSTAIGKPLILVRIGVAVAIATIVFGVVEGVVLFEPDVDELKKQDLVQFIQILEPAVNVLILVGAALAFLFTMEKRAKRTRALAAISELRAMAHVIDMHQLTKDPEGTLKRGERTKASPGRQMTSFELNRYLDYCSEMLSLIGKIAALYSQNSEDDVALAAVREVENLTTGLTRKIWQKIMVLNATC